MSNIPLDYVSMCRMCIGEGVALVLSEPAVDALLGIPEELVGIVKSFHESMKARIRVDGELLEEIEVRNELHQGCTMASSLFNFNLYACLVAERWLDRFTGVEGIGTCLLYKYNTEALKRRNTRRASRNTFYECEFAVDVEGGCEWLVLWC